MADPLFDTPAARLVAEPVAGDNAMALSVGELSGRLKRMVEGEFGHVRLRGEISGYKRVASGHSYLALKDDSAVIDGVTGDQRVFLGWAQVWRGKYRDDMMRQQLVSDPHSPPKYRVDVPVKNIDAFYEAFGVKPGDGMYLAPGDRVRIW